MRRNRWAGLKAWFCNVSYAEVRTPHGAKKFRTRRRASQLAKASRLANQRIAAKARRQRQKRSRRYRA